MQYSMGDKDNIEYKDVWIWVQLRWDLQERVS